MWRRDFLQLGSAVLARASARAQRQVEDLAVAAASQDKTPRVGIVLSSFRGSEDHDGNKIAGLADPRPTDAALTEAQVDGMVRKAIELGNTRRGGLASILKEDDWIVILAPGEADPRVVRSLTAWLAENRRGARITLAGTDSDEILELPVPGKASAGRNPDGVYFIPRTIQQCDRVISVAPLSTHPRTGVSLSIGNYFRIAPASHYGAAGEGLFKLGEPDEVLIDLYTFHTADYAILSGGAGRNLVIAGPSAPAVDAVGAAVLRIDPAKIRHLQRAEKKGFGIADLDLIWTRGNTIAEARALF